jgi:hypothetical protein
VPHLSTVKQVKGLPAHQKTCMHMSVDMWPIHTAKMDDNRSLPWIKAIYPWLAVVFVPGGCE